MGEHNVLASPSELAWMDESNVETQMQPDTILELPHRRPSMALRTEHSVNWSHCDPEHTWRTIKIVAGLVTVSVVAGIVINEKIRGSHT